MRFTAVGLLLLGVSFSVQSDYVNINQLISHYAILKSPHQDSTLLSDKNLSQKLRSLNAYSLPEETTQYRLDLQKIITSYNDSQSGVEDLFQTENGSGTHSIYDEGIGIIKVIPGKHPQLVLMTSCELNAGESGNDYVGQNLFDPEYPYLIAIDDIPVADWMKRLNAYIPFRNRIKVYEHSAEWLQHINQARKMTGEKLSSKAKITLASDDNAIVDHFITLKKSVYNCAKYRSAEVYSVAGSDTLSASKDGEIAYVSLSEMYDITDDNGASKMLRLMEQLRSISGKQGLILDVRDSKQGGRSGLIALYPFLVHRNTPPKVVNLMSYRLSLNEPIQWGNSNSGTLSSEFVFRHNSAIWSDQERQAISAFDITDGMRDLNNVNDSPRLCPANWFNGDNFSRWHYMVMSPRQQFFRNLVQVHLSETEKNTQAFEVVLKLINHWDEMRFSYQRPKQIVVLANKGTSGPMEILLGAIRGMDGVTIMGSLSSGSGGSVARSYTLSNGTTIKLGYTVSLTSEGKLYDVQSIKPDHVVLPSVEAFRFRQYINDNTLYQVVRPEDNQLKQAIHFIKTGSTMTDSI